MGETSSGLEKTAKSILWGLAGRVFSSRNRKPTGPIAFETIHSVLVVRPDRLGDVILSTPVYESLF